MPATGTQPQVIGPMSTCYQGSMVLTQSYVLITVLQLINWLIGWMLAFSSWRALNKETVSKSGFVNK